MSAYQSDLAQLVYELNAASSLAKKERNTSLGALLAAAAEQRASNINSDSPMRRRVEDQWSFDRRNGKSFPPRTCEDAAAPVACRLGE